MFIVDALIGNFDRHGGNWGFIKRNNQYRIAPVYDNGSSLYPKLNTDEKLETVLSSEDEIDQRIYKFPTSHIKVKNRKSSYFEVISNLQFEACNDALKRIVPRIDFNQINAKYRAAANFRHCLNLRRLCCYITSCNHFYSEIGYKLKKPPEGGFRYK